MDFSVVTSKENNLVKFVRKLLTSTRERKTTGLFVLEGLRLCADAALNGYEINTLIVSEKVQDSEKLDVLCKASDTLVKVPDSLFSYMCDTVSPQGVLCVVKKPEFNSVDICHKGKYIVLENTADPANLGTIARTAEALGLSGLIVSSAGCDPFSPKSQRAGMGALLRLPIIISDNVYSNIETLKRSGFSIFASVVSNADCDVREVEYGEKCAVLIGNEANGLTETAIKLCDKKVTITMSGRAESLNAAAAASIFMWEMTRNEVK